MLVCVVGQIVVIHHKLLARSNGGFNIALVPDIMNGASETTRHIEFLHALACFEIGRISRKKELPLIRSLTTYQLSKNIPSNRQNTDADSLNTPV